jgi:SAM-dependent methyltransferase
MIEVAKSLPQDAGIPIDWRECSAFDLPFGEHSFNIAVSAQTIQFLDDRIKALSEMSRVLEPNGQVVISMWCAVHQNPYFKALIDAVTKYLGADTASGLGAAFTLTSQHEIESLLEQAGLKDPTVEAFEIDLNLPEIDQFAARHISATPMNGNFSASSESLQQDLVMEVAEKLEEYQTEAGVKVPFRIHVGKAQRG